jgi:lipopolysaccharide transport system ATP-binding protein
MSDRVAIRLSGVGKMYKMFASRLDKGFDALGLARLMFWRRVKPQEFWALRSIDLEITAGSRVGIIGRNGAGKSTLLKLITGNMAPTEGLVEVNGDVQALLEAGAGFHPEFTGYENIRASLTYQGLTPAQIEATVEEIAEFTELGRFLSQPFKTYSMGMQARLAFATATALKPHILIVDEILGAGDAYFAGKSSERMKELVENSGATVLLVSHALEQVARYCDESIWIERGRIVMRGPSLEVINAYEEFVHRLEDRRLKAKRRKRAGSGTDHAAREGYSDTIVVSLEVTGSAGTRCDVAEVALLANEQPDETLRVGDVQDANPGYASTVSLTASEWSTPQCEAGQWFRRITLEPGRSSARGELAFYLYALLPEIDYCYRIRYRYVGPARVVVTISRNGVRLGEPTPLSAAGAWTEASIPLARGRAPVSQTATGIANGSEEPREAISSAPSVRRWPGEGSVRVEEAVFVGGDGQERAVFKGGSTLTLRVELYARRSGHFNLVVGATLARLDGVPVSNLVSPVLSLRLAVDERRRVSVSLDELLLGDGQYVFSVSLFEGTVQKETRYDLVSGAYEFRVVGNSPLAAGSVFRHPARWNLDPTPDRSGGGPRGEMEPTTPRPTIA